MKKRFVVRQGDVLIVQVSEEIPATAQKIERDKGQVVLAYGEVTGHSHAIASKGAALFAVTENLRMLKLEEEAELRHEEHAVIKLPPGTFQVIQQRENTALGWRTVVD